MIEKTFYRALLEFVKHPEKVKVYLSDKRLTAQEKLILSCYPLFRKNKNKEVVDLLAPQTASASALVESQRLFLLGSSYNCLGEFEKAKISLIGSAEKLRSIEVPSFLFSTLNTLFWVLANLNDVRGLEVVLRELQELPHSREDQEVKLLRCEFCFYQKTHDLESAFASIEKLKHLRSALTEYDSVSLALDKFIFYTQIEDFKLCYEVLDEVKRARSYFLSENFKFMKILLDHHTKNTPIYVYENEFEIEFVYHQLKVIQSFEEGNIDEAQFYWARLVDACPMAYQTNFTYVGEKSIFSLCLERYLNLLSRKDDFRIEVLSNKLETVVQLFSRPDVHISASDLFRVLWGKDPADKEDLRKVSRLISRAKTEKGFEIEFVKGCYSNKASSKKVS